MTETFDFVIIGGGSAGSCLGEPAVLGPREPRARPRGGAPRLPVGPLHPDAGGAGVPDRQPLLRLEVRVRARALHERPPDLPRARQGARRLLQHQRDDLPARQPARLRALGRRPRAWRPGTTRTASPTSSGWRRASPADRADPWRGHSGPLVLERGPATNPLFGAFFEACQQAGYHLTDDVNGFRQEGFAPFDRNIHDGQAAVRGARVPPPRDAPEEPRRAHPRVRHEDPVRGLPRGGRRVHDAAAARRRSACGPARSC